MLSLHRSNWANLACRVVRQALSIASLGSFSLAEVMTDRA